MFLSELISFHILPASLILSLHPMLAIKVAVINGPNVPAMFIEVDNILHTVPKIVGGHH